MQRTHFLLILLLPFLYTACNVQTSKRFTYDYNAMDRTERKIHRRVEKFLDECVTEKYPVPTNRFSRIDSLVLDRKKVHLDIFLNSFFGYVPFREGDIDAVYSEMKSYLGWRFGKYNFTVYSRRFPLEQLVPNYYRSDKNNYDHTRLARKEIRGNPVVTRMSHPWKPDKGLLNRNIALWHSHGWYYEKRLKRWEWQRARLFQTVEDIGPLAYTIPYLVPMLENAGAHVFLPRERDLQIHEVIVDNDDSGTGKNLYNEISGNWENGPYAGFAVGTPPYGSGENPFTSGTFRRIRSDTTESARIEWVPDIPENGYYAVHIAYQSDENNADGAVYSVFHSGGKTVFQVNQQIGGGTWIYLGHFHFKAGIRTQNGKIVLTNRSEKPGKYITADAVRFGGGMGNIIRDGLTSGRPRFVEGARYYLQYAGMPDTLVYNLHADSNDYRDDYQSRGEWVNYLRGAPFGPNRDRNVKGLSIPIDLSLAFHTDAGISPNDTVIGTLSIYSTFDTDSALVFPDSMSRLANRDFADILQTQIVEDIRSLYDPAWNRRGLWDRMYSEAFRPNVPAALLELLSHQNFLDMQFSHDPRFRFHVSRSIYKAMLRFVTTQFKEEYIVQPLPVTHVQARIVDPDEIEVKWQPSEDPLEPTAAPSKYIVYQRIEDNGFNNGTLVDSAYFRKKDVEPGIIYSFRIAAVNAGGESFPSEIVAVCRVDSVNSPVCIVNAFDRVSPPSTIKTRKFAGFVNFIDEGVADKVDVGYTGRQFNFSPPSPWTDDDAPGFGASHANFETKPIPGNTFDFIYTHGSAVRAGGYGFVSASDEAVMDGQIDLNDYRYVDVILGEEKETAMPKSVKPPEFRAFPGPLQKSLTLFCENGGNLFISGSYVGTDLFANEQRDSTDIKFGQNILKMFWRTDHAAITGGVSIVDSAFLPANDTIYYNHTYNPDFYKVEAPDGIEPFGSGAKTIMRYTENNISAGIGYRGKYKLVIFGFPFESIPDEKMRHRVMKGVLLYFDSLR